MGKIGPKFCPPLKELLLGERNLSCAEQGCKLIYLLTIINNRSNMYLTPPFQISNGQNECKLAKNEDMC